MSLAFHTQGRSCDDDHRPQVGDQVDSIIGPMPTGRPRRVLRFLGLGALFLALLVNPSTAAQAQTPTPTPTPPVDPDLCYLVADGSNTLRTFNLLTSVETLIGGTGVPDIEAIALDPSTGVLYAHDGTGAASARLGTLNVATGTFAPIGGGVGTGNGALGAVAFNDLDGLSFDPFTGILYGAQRRGAGEDVLLQVNPITGAFVPDAFGFGIDYVVIPAPAGFPTLLDIDDIAVDPTGGQLFGIANDGGVGDRLIRVNKSTGAVTDVGLMGASDMEGLTFNDIGVLFGTTGSASVPAANSNDLWQINKLTAAATSVASLASTDYEGVACLAQAIPPTPTPTISPTPTPTNTPAATNTSTPTPTDTPTTTPTSTPIPSPTPTGGVVVIDPALSKTADPAGAQVGDTVIFTITVFNNGTADALAVVVSDPIPTFLEILGVTVTPTGPAITVVGNTVTIDIGTVTPTDLFTIAITTQVNALGLPPGGTNTATLTTSSADSVPANNLDSFFIRIDVSGPLPESGFPPGRRTLLPLQPEYKRYWSYDDLLLELPALDVSMPIVGVPITTDGWDVSWLGANAGYLYGTAFPTWKGNSGLAGHITLPSGLPGPFAQLGDLRFGDLVIVRAWGLRHTYEVREVVRVEPKDASVLRHEELSWVTLITCEGFDEESGRYGWRLAVRAVLVRIELADSESSGGASPETRTSREHRR